MEQSVAELLTI